MSIPKGWKLSTTRENVGKQIYETRVTAKTAAGSVTDLILEVNQKTGAIIYYKEGSAVFGLRRNAIWVQRADNTYTVLNEDLVVSIDSRARLELEKLVKINAPLIVKANPDKTERDNVLSQKFYSPSTQEIEPEERNAGVGTTTTDEDDGSSQDGTSPPTPTIPAIFGVTSEDFQEDEPFNSSFLIYPIDINSKQDRIVITQKRYEIPDVLTNGNIDTSKIKDGGFSAERFKSQEKSLGSVILPMPNDISETNVTAWGEDSLSSLAALVGSAALGTVGSIARGDIPNGIEEIKAAFSEILGPGTSANETVRQLLSLNAAAALTKKVGINLNPEAFRSRITGTAINPNLELLFQGPKLRSFGFQFKMTPRSRNEARNIRYILKFFKKGMAAKRNVTDRETAYFLGAPNVFDIQFKSDSSGKEITSIGKIKTCALQQCVVNYTPDGFYAAYQDSKAGGSQPISVLIQLAFTELTPLYNDNYDESIDTVGYDSLQDGPSGSPEIGDLTE